jgi:periplasmic protein TonB
MTSNEVSLTPVFTLVLWLACLAVGGLGMWLPYPRPHAAATPPPLQAQIVNIQVTREYLPPPVNRSSPPVADISRVQPPPRPEAIVTPPPPPLAALAAPSPAIAFAQSVKGPAQTVEPKQAVPVVPVQAPPAVEQLKYGQGEGQQPAPEYPREAALAGQQGAVVIVFNVSEDGSVTTARATSPCPWPLLNQAALRAVRETWRFRAGPVRSYQVSIVFQLTE